MSKSKQTKDEHRKYMHRNYRVMTLPKDEIDSARTWAAENGMTHTQAVGLLLMAGVKALDTPEKIGAALGDKFLRDTAAKTEPPITCIANDRIKRRIKYQAMQLRTEDLATIEETAMQLKLSKTHTMHVMVATASEMLNDPEQAQAILRNVVIGDCGKQIKWSDKMSRHESAVPN